MNVGVVIGREENTSAGWAFDVVVRCGSDERDHRAHMSWVDYDYWCGGSTSPADVTRIAIETALQSIDADNLPSSFDLSTVRRQCAGFDVAMHARLGRSGAANANDWADETGARKAG